MVLSLFRKSCVLQFHYYHHPHGLSFFREYWVLQETAIADIDWEQHSHPPRYTGRMSTVALTRVWGEQIQGVSPNDHQTKEAQETFIAALVFER